MGLPLGFRVLSREELDGWTVCDFFDFLAVRTGACLPVRLPGVLDPLVIRAARGLSSSSSSSLSLSEEDKE